MFWKTSNFIKKRPQLRCFRICETCGNTFFHRTSPVAAFVFSETKKVKMKKSRSKETFFLAEVDVTNKKVFTRSSHPDVFCSKRILKYLVKLTGKHLCRSLCLACRGETLFKKRVLYRCFPIKLSGDLFPRTPVNSLITLTIMFNFVEYLKFWCIKQSENVFRTYC